MFPCAAPGVGVRAGVIGERLGACDKRGDSRPGALLGG